MTKLVFDPEVTCVLGESSKKTNRCWTWMASAVCIIMTIDGILIVLIILGVIK